MKKLLSLLFIAAAIIAVSCETTDESAPNVGSYPPDMESNYGGDKFEDYGENPFVKVADQPLSTFAVDADGAAYAIMRKYVTSEMSVPVASVRIEEYLNYFTFDYPSPTDGHALSVTSEITRAPWSTSNYLLRFGLKGKDLPMESLPPENYVLLVDVSGSMASTDKLELAKAGFKLLARNMRDNDRMAIVTYSGKSEVLLASTLGTERDKIINAISALETSGATAGEAAIRMAYQQALDNYIPNSNNRVIMATDGDFNVGLSSTDELVDLVETYLSSGIYLTVLGFGSGNLNDAMMEQIANHGNGNYEYIDNINQMRKVFVDERNKFYVVAKDSKIQVSFDSSAVHSYRLIGYENRVMSNEEFNDSTKDAGEVGMGQTITAIYEIVPKDNTTGNVDIAALSLRYKDVDTEATRDVQHAVSANYAVVNETGLSPNQSLAAAVAMYGMMLKVSEYKGATSKTLILQYLEQALSFDPNGHRAEFKNIVNVAL